MNETRPSPRSLVVAPHPDEATLPPAAVREAGVRTLRGVPYAEVEGSRPLELDLWLPARTNSPAALVLFVHGGAWMRGRRDDMGPRTRDWSSGPFARLAAEGLAVACLDYRLSGEALFPAQVDDLHSALRWLTLRGDELGIDTTRTVVWGESAGGHLAALLALTRPTPSPRGAVIWYGPGGDLTAERENYSPWDPDTPEARLLGAAPASDVLRAHAASPSARVHPQAPPFLLVHGEGDTMVSCSHSRELAAALRHQGVSAELRTVPDCEHGWYGVSEEEVEDVFARSLAFAARVLG
ncbi:alpha/beta hydrolase [Actinopolyspora mortivallis]|uniref:alpha/beta hydrolase n=1 Tax=Actinopolyspora mortivallis TaxID=33906 RepID=UPI00036F03C5|nr:alpha/beta hydrolase [Actinopolyspora mortivallis]